MISYCLQSTRFVYEGYLKRHASPLVDDVKRSRQEPPAERSSGKLCARRLTKETRGRQDPSMEPSSTRPGDRETAPTLADETRNGSQGALLTMNRRSEGSSYP